MRTAEGTQGHKESNGEGVSSTDEQVQRPRGGQACPRSWMGPGCRDTENGRAQEGCAGEGRLGDFSGGLDRYERPSPRAP